MNQPPLLTFNYDRDTLALLTVSDPGANVGRSVDCGNCVFARGQGKKVPPGEGPDGCEARTLRKEHEECGTQGSGPVFGL
jgi:hypothetical protein